MAFSMSSAASGTMGTATEVGSTDSGECTTTRSPWASTPAPPARALRDELLYTASSSVTVGSEQERMTAEYFNWTTKTGPVLIQDALTMFVVAAPLLFYLCRECGPYSDNSFPGVFFPCDGYGHTGRFDMGIIHLSCTAESPSPGGCATATAVPPPYDETIQPNSSEKKTTCAATDDDFQTEPCTTADSERELTLDLELASECDDSEPLRLPAPGSFVKAVLDEAKSIFHDNTHLQRIASHFLSRFRIYDQIVISALLAECTHYNDDAPLNCLVVNTIYDIVKRHIAVLDDGVFTLQIRETELASTRWFESCKAAFKCHSAPLPTPAFVFNQFVDSMAMDREYSRLATEDEKLAALIRQHTIATCMTRLVYPTFSPNWDAMKRAAASNSVFQAAGYRATSDYVDPMIQITSVGRITATILLLIQNLRKSHGRAYDKFAEACEACFIH
ncbi:hypothetical protein JKP88DRAFT_251685 [Tribonema minus]|uniref:Uncharacterized protein n=1 Tax=Tribonema minus TaxID=303371 RepID=A0A835ZE12_9STRA|nr:hypothetical protein JKP88DRAFT_251685 [Tribonema minus]